MNSDQPKDIVTVQFPLRGEWYAWTSPKEYATSHQTEKFGQKYAYDFVQGEHVVKYIGLPKLSKSNFLRALTFGVPSSDYYCWRAKVYASLNGEVVSVCDGKSDPKTSSLLFGSFFKDQFKQSKVDDTYFKKRLFSKKRTEYNLKKADEAASFFHQIAGNYLVIKHEDKLYSFYAHLYCNSIKMSVGDIVKAGDLLGEVGHSGHSASPHLHFQLMDRADVWNSKGIPCNFYTYEEHINGKWVKQKKSIPGQPNKIRFEHEEN
jgi:hypothetical protein